MQTNITPQTKYSTRGSLRIKDNTERRQRKLGRGKVISITNSECMFASLVIEHAKRMCSITLSTVACPVVQYFFHNII
jgi:hypothetical protein